MNCYLCGEPGATWWPKFKHFLCSNPVDCKHPNLERRRQRLCAPLMPFSLRRKARGHCPVPDYTNMVPSEEALRCAIEFLDQWLTGHPDNPHVQKSVETLYGMLMQKGAFPDAGSDVEKLTDAIDIYMHG